MGMSLAFDIDGLAELFDDSMPWLEAWGVILAAVLIAFVAMSIGHQFRKSSPVERLLKRRVG